jgi:hypothetical protein
MSLKLQSLSARYSDGLIVVHVGSSVELVVVAVVVDDDDDDDDDDDAFGEVRCWSVVESHGTLLVAADD